MGRKKLEYFEHIALANNVLEEGKELFEIIKGKWNELYFKNNNPIILEIACGKGEYTVGLAQLFPDSNFIGIDVKGDRIAVGSKKAEELGLTNVAFLRTNVYFIEDYFAENEVSDIWIMFPDPFNIKNKRENRRLTSFDFLSKYKKIIKDSGFLRLKTDNLELFEYSVGQLELAKIEILDQTTDLYNSDLNQEHFGLITKFESVFVKRGFSIKYLKAQIMK